MQAKSRTGSLIPVGLLVLSTCAAALGESRYAKVLRDFARNHNDDVFYEEAIKANSQEYDLREDVLLLTGFLASSSDAQVRDKVGIPAKANTDSEGNANGIPGRRRTALGA